MRSYLRRYGPEADGLRDLLRRYTTMRFQDLFPPGSAKPVLENPGTITLFEEFVAIEPEGDGVRVSIGEETPAFQVLQVLLQPTQRPLAVRAKLENFPANLARFIT